MNNIYCKHYWPTKRRTHLVLQLGYYIDKFIITISKPLQHLYKNNFHAHQAHLWRAFLEFLSFFKIVQFIDKPNEQKLYNRSLIFFHEAKRRNLKIQAVRFFYKYINEFRFTYKNKTYYYEGIPLRIFNKSTFDMDHKYNCKKILQENNLPVATGQIFTSTNQALKFVNKIGFPLVVKPCNASLSHHVTCQINSAQELLRGIKIAKQYTPAFIVEKYIQGDLFRASVVGKSHVFICQKDRANIVGDGSSTIEELIIFKNTQHQRGDTHQMNSTLHKIPINDTLITNLRNQGLSLKTTLRPDHKIYLQDKYVLSHGCDIISCHQLVHTKNKELFLKIANILQSDLVGIDFICPDISKPYDQQKTAVLELNSLPYIDMHQYPSHGQPEPVAKIVWDIVLNKLDTTSHA